MLGEPTCVVGDDRADPVGDDDVLVRHRLDRLCPLIYFLTRCPGRSRSRSGAARERAAGRSPPVEHVVRLAVAPSGSTIPERADAVDSCARVARSCRPYTRLAYGRQEGWTAEESSSVTVPRTAHNADAASAAAATRGGQEHGKRPRESQGHDGPEGPYYRTCLARRRLALSADFRAARSALLFRVCVVEAVAAPPGHGGVGEVGCA